MRARCAQPESPESHALDDPIVNLKLSSATLARLRAAGIHRVDELAPARELLRRPALASGAELYEVVCALSRRGLSLTGVGRRVAPEREREMLRLRIVEGLTLEEIGQRFAIKRERVRQLLALYFGLSGRPPARRAKKRSTR
jgi:hypothetical protein